MIFDSNWRVFGGKGKSCGTGQKIAKKGNGKKGWSGVIEWRFDKISRTRFLSRRRTKKFSLTMKTIRKWSFGVSYKQRAEYSFLEREIETASFQTIGFLRNIDCIEKQASINLWKRYTRINLIEKNLAKQGLGRECRIEHPWTFERTTLHSVRSFLPSLFSRFSRK